MRQDRVDSERLPETAEEARLLLGRAAFAQLKQAMGAGGAANASGSTEIVHRLRAADLFDLAGKHPLAKLQRQIVQSIERDQANRARRENR